ncbi:MAG: 16S rRNA processing protein RimM [Saprospiraceae bacterium]|nr:16S rRNA processing protein RimM [Saprospiraceae bacterium]
MLGNLVQIGFTKKPHGLKGEIKLHIHDQYLEDVMNTEVVILQIKGKPTPFFVDDIRVGNAIIGKFEDIDTPEAALSIANKELFLREQDIIPDDEREFEVEDDGLKYLKCIGYAIFDGEHLVGEILDILEFPQQEMAVVEYQNREILIPLNVAFVRKKDDAAKKILMELPEGLLDL